MDTKGENGGGMNWEVGIEIYMLLYKREITTENLLYSSGNSMLCGDLNGREIQNIGDICIYIANFLFCTEETNTTL